MARTKYRKRFKKKERPFLKRRVFWDFFLVLLLVFLISYFLFFSGFFKIKRIEFLAGENYLQKEIGGILIGKLEDNLLLLNTQSLENRILKNYPEIAYISLKKEFPASLLVNIKKRVPVALFCFSGEEKCSLIDSQGIIFKGDNSGNLSPIYSERIPSSQIMRQVLFVGRKLKNAEIVPEAFRLSGNELDVKTKEGWEIYLNLKDDLSLALTKLNLLLEKEISSEERKNLQYIDLRFSKAYYK